MFVCVYYFYIYVDTIRYNSDIQIFLVTNIDKYKQLECVTMSKTICIYIYVKLYINISEYNSIKKTLVLVKWS